ncbi:type I DNA topoisomerase [Deinococcus peraridilitoris]|uniref:DNA topoisomerase 1 n=1 Tax=Deinococcus peraridilitoris (strain DSM 19664 / LMG 22246 / CIP 109416 / KR-200) TaxID=937777 RepID=L0A8G6_DEIPD|nr:type I DNA topoisomerase [Deinococcus peraridilitoris]AFZ69375.1 DNA topoisomerase I, bacterial [Deinococcus peraridilitoris DSM 19664]
MRTLVIVESPSKGKKIQSLLGNAYVVRASLGHIRDLPASKNDVPEQYRSAPWARTGVDVAGGFKPLYVISRKKAKVVKELREAAKNADRVLIATDPDREGEAIGWHLTRVLNLKDGQFARMTFTEITKDAIHQAAQNPRTLDYHLVGAQEARRLIDRLVGFGVSPLLWNVIGSGLSAGRVQSAALKILADREEERMNFTNANYWRVTANVMSSPSFIATVTHVRENPLALPRDFDANGTLKNDVLLMTTEQAAQLKTYLSRQTGVIDKVTTTPFTQKPPAPFTTSTLQQEAARQLRLRAEQTMKLAQTLYEGGYITYHRTDSPSLSSEAQHASRQAIEQQYGAQHLPERARQYQAKAKNAQEAHEAIRPSGTDFKTPKETDLNGELLSVYDLIYRRTIACQMNDAQGEKTVVVLQAGVVKLQATGKRLTYPGFTLAYQDAQEDLEEEQTLPSLPAASQYPLKDVKTEEKRTTPPGRYSEASLVQTLERAGIGRPSTYAQILTTLQARGYMRPAGRQLAVTWLGLLVSTYLTAAFDNLVSKDFTAKMEADLDAIAEGKQGRVPYLEAFWTNGLERTIAGATRRAPILGIPKVPGATCSARGGIPTLSLNGRHVVLPESLAPDELNLEVVEAVLAGHWSASPAGRKASFTSRQAGTHPKTTSGKRTTTRQAKPGKARVSKKSTP